MAFCMPAAPTASSSSSFGLRPCFHSDLHGAAMWVVHQPRPFHLLSVHRHQQQHVLRMLGHHRRPYGSMPVNHLIVCSAQLNTETEALESSSSSSSPTPSSSSDSAMVDNSVSVLKKAAKTRKVAPLEVFSAIRVLEKAKLDPSNFLETIGGGSSGPRTWMLIFTSSKKQVSESMRGGQGGGSYFPITAVQKFDSNAKTIENGVYLGPLGSLTFQGRFSWKTRILAFIFESINIKIGSLDPFKFNIQKKEDEGRLPTTKDPFFIWFYADEEIIVAKGRGGGLAFWCRCARVKQ